MPSIERNAVLFIDANQYLQLYGLGPKGKKLLDLLDEQKNYIFVSAQLVHEVLRNKLRCAHHFFSSQLKELGEIKAPVSDHLLGISDEKATEFRTAFEDATRRRKELASLVAPALARISRSDDEVSKRLAPLFDNAISPNADEMQRARERKEKGNPPGKPGDSLGDQITWEQLLSHCAEGKPTGLWIITSDRDFFIEYERQCLLNPLLVRNVIDACGEGTEVYCFSDLMDGVTDFVKRTGVKAEKLPSEPEASEIRKEIEALPPRGGNTEGLPPIGWFMSTDDSWMVAATTAAARRKSRAAIDSGDRSFLNYQPPTTK